MASEWAMPLWHSDSSTSRWESLEIPGLWLGPHPRVRILLQLYEMGPKGRWWVGGELGLACVLSPSALRSNKQILRGTNSCLQRSLPPRSSLCRNTMSVSLWPEDKDDQEPAHYRSYLPFLINISTSVQPDFIHSSAGSCSCNIFTANYFMTPLFRAYRLPFNHPLSSISSVLINPAWKQTVQGSGKPKVRRS